MEVQMSRVLGVVCVLVVAIVLLAPSSPAGPEKSLASRVAELESIVGGQATAIADLEDAVDALASHEHDSEYVTSPDEDLRIIRGTVLYDGTILYGDGFRVTWNSSDTYEIYFDTEFSDYTTVLVQALGSDSARAHVDVNTTTGFSVVTTDGAEASFRFIAIGPQ